MSSPPTNEFSTVVYVLGAGASHDAGLPLYFELLSPALGTRLFNRLRELPAYLEMFSSEIDDLMRDSLELQQKYGTDLEQILDRLYTEDPDAYQAVLSHYYRAIQLSDTIYQSISLPDYLSSGLAANFDILKAHGRRPAIISFNHDLLVEYGLLPYSDRLPFSYCLSSSHADDYGSATIGMTVAPHFDSGHIYGGAEIIPLLKLHGSFNWLYCDACDYLLIGADTLQAVGKTPCPRCKRETLQISILPPRRGKQMRAFGGLWKTAEELLSVALSVCFVGYSLPDYDIDAFDLFRCNVNPSATITIMAPSHPDDLRKRYARAFPNSSINFVDSSFSDYLLQCLKLATGDEY
jgi:RNAse (barnase) inhibitor barstar